MFACFSLFCALTYFPMGHNAVDSVMEAPMVQILSEPEGNVIHQISVNLDDEGGIIEVTSRSEDYNAAIAFQELIDGEVVLAAAEGIDVLTLSCLGCSKDEGGTLVFGYLKNGLSGKWGSMDFKLAKKGEWSLSTGKELVQTLTLKSNRIFGRVVGIKEILVNDW